MCIVNFYVSLADKISIDVDLTHSVVKDVKHLIMMKQVGRIGQHFLPGTIRRITFINTRPNNMSSEFKAVVLATMIIMTISVLALAVLVSTFCVRKKFYANKKIKAQKHGGGTYQTRSMEMK